VVALDKTGTLTTGALTLSDGFMLDLGNGSHSATTSSSSSSQTAASVAERITISPMPAASSWLGHASNSGSSSSSWALLGASPSDGKFHADAVKCAVALSRLSNHPVSRALVEAGQAADADVSVLSFEQVPGAGVQGVCQIGDEPAVMVRFGALDWVASFLPEAALVTDALHMRTGDQHDKPSRAVAFITMSDVAATPDQQQQQQPGQPGSQLSMLCFEDVIQAGVPAAVQQLQSGGWCSSWLQPAASSKKSVVMLTGEMQHVRDMVPTTPLTHASHIT
jgi:cation transport ATPase